MSVIFTAEAESRRLKALQERRAKTPVTWELLRTTSLVEALHFAREKGWKEKKVQVKGVQISNDEVEYHVEPYEKDCMCPGILRYDEYFD